MTHQIFYVLLLLLLPFIVSTTATLVSLTGGGWTITDHQLYSAQGSIPGTIHTILFTAKQIPEPYWRYNDIDLRYLIYTPWTFTKNFTLTNDFLTMSQFTLHFDQVDTVANITLNECVLGQTNNMFLAYTFNVTKSCLQSNNQLRVDIESPIIYALKQARVYNHTVPPDCPPSAQHGECYFQFIRKEPCSFSWGWGPAFAPIGIPGDVSLQGIQNNDIIIELESVNVASYQNMTNKWQVDVMLTSRNEPFTSQLRFVLENTSFSYETNITFSHDLSVSLLIPNDTVQLWWPNGYGNQTLYTLSVYNQGQLIGSRVTGFRTVELAQHNYGPNIKGLSFYFVINGQPIYIKGSNWIPPDSFQERVSDERLERLLRSTQLANMNMLRIWGGGIYERNSFYDMADRLGIMLWHDFMFACSTYSADELFLTNVYNEIIYQVKRLQSHSSIVLWSGNNENEALIAQNWYSIPKERIPKAKDDYRKLYVGTVMRAVKEIDKGTNRPFVTSSPSNGLESIHENFIAQNPQDPLYGDVHFYSYYNDSWDPRAYPIARFLSETGIQALPSLDTWYEVTNDTSDLQYLSQFAIDREHSPHILNDLLIQIKTNLPLPSTNNSLRQFTEMIYLSQINQAMTLKSISDACRAYSSVEMIDPQTSQGHTMGLMYWQINDIWQAPTYSTIEYGLKWKMGHYFVKHMFEPVYPLAILTPYLADVKDESARLSLYVVNELFTGTTGRLNCSFLSLDSFSDRSSTVYDVSFTAPGLQNITSLPYSIVMKNAGCMTGNQCLFHCRYNDNQQEIGQTVFLSQPKNYQLYQPNLQIESVEPVSSTEVTITITATRPALFVWLNAVGNVSGYFSQNGFHMLEPRRTVSFYSWSPMVEVEKTNFDVTITSLYDVTQP